MKTKKISFKEFCDTEAFCAKVLLHEFICYKPIPHSGNSFRQDSENTNTKTVKHAHVYAQLNGNGKELYSVGVNGKGHDGYSGTTIPQAHADFFRRKGYIISDNNVLESLNISKCDLKLYRMIILTDSLPIRTNERKVILNENNKDKPLRQRIAAVSKGVSKLRGEDIQYKQTVNTLSAIQKSCHK